MRSGCIDDALAQLDASIEGITDDDSAPITEKTMKCLLLCLKAKTLATTAGRPDDAVPCLQVCRLVALPPCLAVCVLFWDSDIFSFVDNFQY